eukprot:7778346-Pyramimonas_sp.AAC.1
MSLRVWQRRSIVGCATHANWMEETNQLHWKDSSRHVLYSTQKNFRFNFVCRRSGCQCIRCDVESDVAKAMMS